LDPEIIVGLERQEDSSTKVSYLPIAARVKPPHIGLEAAHTCIQGKKLVEVRRFAWFACAASQTGERSWITMKQAEEFAAAWA
jgi:hypothetical protein